MGDRLAAVKRRIEEACGRAGRDPAGVAIVAVTKTLGPDVVREAADWGLDIFGENRVQEAVQKIPLCPGRVRWHMIGHLQRNKARMAAEWFQMIHSVDSPRLLEALDRAAAEAGRRLPVLIEVNVAGEASKFGVSPRDGESLLRMAGGLRSVEVRGVMTVPPFTPDPEGSRGYFRRLRQLRDRWQDACGFPLPDLSMGMSHDFDVAVQEGATWIRLGEVLFGPRRGKQWAPGRTTDDEAMEP